MEENGAARLTEPNGKSCGACGSASLMVSARQGEELMQ
jgi:hypothetical protein